MMNWPSIVTRWRIRGESLQKHVREHLFFWLTVPLAALVFLGVEQVANEWSQFPPPTVNGYLFVGYWAYVLLLLYFLVLSPFVVVPWRDPDSKRMRSRWFSLLIWPINRPLNSLNFLVSQQPVAALVVGVLLLLAAAAILTFGAAGDGSRAYPLAGAICRVVGFLSLLTGGWLIGMKCSQRLNSTNAIGPVQHAQGRMLVWLMVTLVFGEAVWLLASNELTSQVVSYRLYSIWAAVHLLGVLIVTATLVDYWHRLTPWPIRQVALLAIPVFLLSMGPQPMRNVTIQDVPPAETAQLRPSVQPTAWYDHLQRRIESIPEQEPLIIVAASGGGSRAAIFTALALETLAHTPIVESSDSMSRSWADNILLISSVSGGSLASAYYVNSDGGPSPVATDLRNTTRDELIDRMTRLVNELPRSEIVDVDNSRQRAIRFCKALTDGSLDELIGEDPSYRLYDWILKSSFVDDMCIDFMAPVLRGTLAPGISRGNSLARFWEERFRWKDSTNLHGYANRYDPAQHPLLLINVSEVGNGSRLVVGFPPLPPKLLELANHDRPNDPHPRSFDDLFSGPCMLPLARAVQFSSNFPWGFQVIELRPQTQTQPSVRILDGGVVDNTGLDTIYELFNAMQLDTESDPTGKASRILDLLRHRKVVIFEVDSGAKPKRSNPARLLAGAIEPVQALNNAAYIGADRAREHYLVETKRALKVRLNRSRTEISSRTNEPGDQIQAWIDYYQQHVPDTAFHVVFQCNHVRWDATDQKDQDVMTAWTLGPEDKARVVVRFLIELGLWDSERQLFHDASSQQWKQVAALQRRVDELVANPTAMGQLIESRSITKAANSLYEKTKSLVESAGDDPANRIEQKNLDDLSTQATVLHQRVQQIDKLAVSKLSSAEVEKVIDMVGESTKGMQSALQQGKARPAETVGLLKDNVSRWQTELREAAPAMEDATMIGSLRTESQQLQRQLTQKAQQSKQYFQRQGAKKK